MPKIDKKSIKRFNAYPTLKVFKYENSNVFHVEMYVGTKIDNINDKKISSGNLRHSLKTKVSREAETSAKQIYKTVFQKIENNQITRVVYDFDKIVESYFVTRSKQYQAKGKNIANMSKEQNQYYNYCSPHFYNIDYNNEIDMNNAILDLVNDLKETRKDTTINKYMNILNQIFKHAQKKGVMKSIPDVPTFSRINEEVPPYFYKDLRLIRNRIDEMYKETEDPFYILMNDYISFLSALKINRAGLNSLNVKKFQFSETKDSNFTLPIVKCSLYKTKNNPRVSDVCEPWFVDQYYPRLMRNCQLEDHVFAPEVSDRRKLYEKIRKKFVEVSSELGLYVYNGKTRPLYSIRHTNALKIYEETKDINAVAQALNTNPDIVKSNYLNFSDEWARNRFRELRYDKYKKYKSPQSSVKSKNKISEK